MMVLIASLVHPSSATISALVSEVRGCRARFSIQAVYKIDANPMRPSVITNLVAAHVLIPENVRVLDGTRANDKEGSLCVLLVKVAQKFFG